MIHKRENSISLECRRPTSHNTLMQHSHGICFQKRPSESTVGIIVFPMVHQLARCRVPWTKGCESEDIIKALRKSEQNDSQTDHKCNQTPHDKCNTADKYSKIDEGALEIDNDGNPQHTLSCSDSTPEKFVGYSHIWSGHEDSIVKDEEDDHHVEQIGNVEQPFLKGSQSRHGNHLGHFARKKYAPPTNCRYNGISDGMATPSKRWSICHFELRENTTIRSRCI